MNSSRPVVAPATLNQEQRGAIGVYTVSAGRVAMRSQKGVDGVTRVGAEPVFLITGVTKQTAETFLATLLPDARPPSLYNDPGA